MTFEVAHLVGLSFGCRFRITTAKNAQKHFGEQYSSDAFYGKPDGPIAGGDLILNTKNMVFVCLYCFFTYVYNRCIYIYICVCMYVCIYVYLFPWRKPDWWVLGLEAWKVTFCSSSWVRTAATLNFFLKMSTSFEARAETTNIYVQKTAIDPPNRLGDAAGGKVCLSLG